MEPEEFKPVLSASEKERLQKFFGTWDEQKQKEDEAIVAYAKVLGEKRAKRKAGGK